MRKGPGFTIAMAISVVLLATTVPAFAYTVTGDLSSSGLSALSGSVTYTGSLSGLFDTISGEATYINNGTPYNDMYANQDYIVATSSSGAQATFSVGEITVGSAVNSISISGNSTTGYTISGGGQTLSNVSNIQVVHTTEPTGPGGYSTQLVINGNFTPTGAVTFTSSNLPGSYSTVTVPQDFGGSHNYTGVSLYTLLSQAGVNMSNYNQYVIATGTDGGEALLSMDEIINNSANLSTDIIATLEDGSPLSQTRGYFRLVLPTDTSTARSIFTLASLTVESSSTTPIPPSLVLFGTGLVGFVGIRKKICFLG
jgi:hypothetical protein